MIVLLDIDNQKIQLYSSDGLVEIPFEKASTLLRYTGGENVYYVTNAIEANVHDIVDVIRQMGIVVDEVPNDIPVDNGNKYLHAVNDGTIFAGPGLKFDGKFDFKLYDEELAGLIQQTPLVQQLIQAKKLEFVGEIKRANLIKEYQARILKKSEKHDLKEAKLEGMILTTSVADYNGIPPDEHDAIEINLLARGPVSDSGGVGTMSELMDAIDGVGD